MTTPTPYTPPDGVILTTAGEARRIGHGQVRKTAFDDLDVCDWYEIDSLRLWAGGSLVWWRPTPERTVTIDLTRTELRNLAETPDVGGSELEKIEEALARLDGEK